MTTGERATGPGVVVAVCKDAAHRFSKQSTAVIRLVAGLGVEGDAHYGQFVRHRYLARRNLAGRLAVLDKWIPLY